MINILIFNWRDTKNPLSGGAELVTLKHAKAWVKAGNKVTWFTSVFPNSKKEETIDGVKIIRKGNYWSVYLKAFFFYHFSNNSFDVVIDEIHGIPFFTPFYVRKPKIAFIHEVAGVIWDYMYPFPINKMGKIFEKFYFLFYKNVLFWTDAPSTIDDLVKKGIDRKNCIAIACPVNNKVCATMPKKEKELTFIFVSRLVKMKGIENVLEAFALIYKENPKSKLWIVGGGNLSYLNILKEKISKLEKLYKLDERSSFIDSIKFWGRVSDEKKLELMGKAHLLLHASVKEGWGLVILEAVSQGTPSVVYRVAGLVDSVKNGQTGVVINENKPEILAQEALKLLSDKVKYKQLQLRGIAWVKSLTWDKATKESLKLLMSL